MKKRIANTEEARFLHHLLRPVFNQFYRMPHLNQGMYLVVMEDRPSIDIFLEREPGGWVTVAPSQDFLWSNALPSGSVVRFSGGRNLIAYKVKNVGSPTIGTKGRENLFAEVLIDYSKEGSSSTGYVRKLRAPHVLLRELLDSPGRIQDLARAPVVDFSLLTKVGYKETVESFRKYEAGKRTACLSQHSRDCEDDLVRHGTLGEMRMHLDFLIFAEGEDAPIDVDAGYNNISVLIN